MREGDRITIGEYALQVSLPSSHTGAEARPESSLSMARGMVRDLLERLGPGESQPSLRVLDGPQTGVMLTIGDVGRTYILGRAAGNDLRLDDVDMWREHAALERDELGVTIRSAGTHAVDVNGERVAVRAPACTTATRSRSARRRCAITIRPRSTCASSRRRSRTSRPALSRPIAVTRPPEMALVVLGVLAAMAALGGILYVLLW